MLKRIEKVTVREPIGNLISLAFNFRYANFYTNNRSWNNLIQKPTVATRIILRKALGKKNMSPRWKELKKKFMFPNRSEIS